MRLGLICNACVFFIGFVTSFRFEIPRTPRKLSITRMSLEDIKKISIAGTAALMSSFIISSQSAFCSPSTDELVREVVSFNDQVRVEETLQKKVDENKKITKLPFVDKEEDFRMIQVRDSDIGEAAQKIQALYPYLDEVEYLVTVKKWNYLGGFLGVFSDLEEEFLTLIDGLYPSEKPADKSSREAMQYEAQNIFLALDDLNQASKLKSTKSAERSYVKLALAYDRFLKAGNMAQIYDPVTSTEPFYKSFPDSSLKYDKSNPPKLKDPILVLKGPDKGRTGRLIGLIKSRQEAIVKMDYYNEVKLLDLSDVAKQIMKDSSSPMKISFFQQ